MVHKCVRVLECMREEKRWVRCMWHTCIGDATVEGASRISSVIRMLREQCARRRCTRQCDCLLFVHRYVGRVPESTRWAKIICFWSVEIMSEHAKARRWHCAMGIGLVAWYTCTRAATHRCALEFLRSVRMETHECAIVDRHWLRLNSVCFFFICRKVLFLDNDVENGRMGDSHIMYMVM